MSIEDQFNAAVKVIQSLPKDGFFQPSDEMRLRFYAFFKQATEGPNTTKKPAFYEIVNRYKWDAWKQCGEMTRHEAMRLYVEELKKVIETISINHEVSEFLNILGPFYEFLPEDITQKNQTDNQQNNQNKMDNEITSNLEPRVTSYDSEGDEFIDTYDFNAVHSNQETIDSGPPVFTNGLDDDELGCSSMVNKKRGNSPQQSSQNKVIQNQLTTVLLDNNASRQQNGTPLAFNEQLTMAIFQLQHSIDRISNRIHTIEQKQINLEQSINGDDGELIQRNKAVDHNWPFKEFSFRTTIFLFTWPVLVFFLINYLKRFKKK